MAKRKTFANFSNFKSLTPSLSLLAYTQWRYILSLPCRDSYYLQIEYYFRGSKYREFHTSTTLFRERNVSSRGWLPHLYKYALYPNKSSVCWREGKRAGNLTQMMQKSLFLLSIHYIHETVNIKTIFIYSYSQIWRPIGIFVVLFSSLLWCISHLINRSQQL